jgi:hypothetical protein
LTGHRAGWYGREVRVIWLCGLSLAVILGACPPDAEGADAAYVTPLAATPGLSSGFGEFRGGHFHAGLDYSTEQVEGKPVRAIADGWVERVRSSGVGYGRAVYLRLADGRTAVFGHLSRFAPRLDAYVAVRQDSAGVYEQDLNPAPGEVSFRKGEVVAWTGQSGAGPPHLHFELRRGDMNLNPLLHGFALPDRTSPSLAAARFRPAGMGARAPERAIALRAGAVVQAPEIRGPFRLELSTWDRADGRPNKLATYRLEAQLDGRPAFLAVIDSVSWDHAIEAERVYDYASTLAGADTWRPLELLPTYRAGIIRQGPPVWALAPGAHRFDFTAVDEAGNRVTAGLALTVLPPDTVFATEPPPGTRCGEDSLPCSLDVRGSWMATTLTIPGGSLYEPALVTAQWLGTPATEDMVALTAIIQFGPSDLVLRTPARIVGYADIGPLSPRGLFLRQTNSWSLITEVKPDRTFEGSSRRLGAIAVFADTTAPRIVPSGAYRWRAAATAPAFAASLRDRGAGLSAGDQAAYLDDRRVPAEYDPESGRLTWRPRARIAPGRHTLRFEAVDRLGNRAVKAVALEVE